MKKISIALTAHVDAGKTTLAEAMLHVCGAVRKPGRVDQGSAALDYGSQEKRRGITVFAGEATLNWKGAEIGLLDTPGHVDFSPETERVLAAADAAILVISGLDGVQAHTLSLWKLLAKRKLPVILFVSKMDAGRRSRDELLAELEQSLSRACLPVEKLVPEDKAAVLDEEAALLDEALLERYLSGGTLSGSDGVRLVRERRAFPLIFGSGLKEEGIQRLLDLLEALAQDQNAAETEPFGALVYKISYDEKGSRLTHLKCSSGKLHPRDEIVYPDGRGSEKITQIRRYTGNRFIQEDELSAGSTGVIAGLALSRSGDALGAAEISSAKAFFEPVMRYHLCLPEGVSPDVAAPALRRLEEEDPSLHLHYASEAGLIFANLMGPVQGEVLTELIRERFGWNVTLEQGRILYRETLTAPVEGVGHYEPLRHYAEVHLALKPLPRGSGIIYRDEDRGRYLAGDMRRLILGQLAQKTHKGVLTGSELTDVEIVLLGGRFHEKHTEGGDFREAAWRAVRQGLMRAEKKGHMALLEPYMAFEIRVPPDKTGRVLSDIHARSGEAQQTGERDGLSLIGGRAPLSTMQDYAAQLSSFTGGRGGLRTWQDGYDLCHDEADVIRAAGYNPVADREDPPDSVFCRNGGGFSVPWDEVPSYMHLPFLAEEAGDRKADREAAGNARAASGAGSLGTDDELEAIMLREFGPIKRPVQSGQKREWNSLPYEQVELYSPQEMIVDGYNLIFAWPEIHALAEKSLDLAREKLEQRLQNYAAFSGRHIELVFDGYKVKGGTGSEEEKAPLSIVYTAENETADVYIEKELSRRRSERAHPMPLVVSGDNLIRLAVIRFGGLRMSCEAFVQEYEAAMEQLAEITKKSGKKLAAPLMEERPE